MKGIPNPFKSILVQIGILLSIVFLCIIFNDWYAKFFVASGFPLLQTLRFTVLNLIPFSWGDLVYFVFFIVCIRAFFVFFRKKQWRKKRELELVVLRFLHFNLFVGLLLYLLWSSLYAQPKLSTRLGLQKPNDVSNEMLICFDDTLSSRDIFCCYTPVPLFVLRL
jgi:hypothetical protein